ncbi:MAG: LCP family protein [Candidatus Aquicultor sp.]
MGKHAADKPRKTGYLRVLILWSLVLSLLIGGAGFVYARFLEERIHETSGLTKNGANSQSHLRPEEDNEPVTFVMLGCDKRAALKDDPGRSDTLMVLRMNPEKNIAYLISIPRDARVEIPGYGHEKINAAYQHGGPDLVIETVNNLFGFDINHYVLIDFEGFRQIVDQLGGIDSDGEKRMQDHFQGRDIDIAPGMQHFDGPHALDYVRIRHVDDDFGRMGRQQQFIKAVLEKVMSFGGILRIPGLVNTASNYVTTDPSVGVTEMMKYGQMMKSIGRENLHMITLPGEAKMIGPISYVVLDQPKVDWLVYRIKNDMPLELTAEEKQNENIKIGVQNGSGKPGMAKVMADKLGAFGYKIEGVGNAQSFNHQETKIVSVPGKEELAQRIRDQLGIGTVINEGDITDTNSGGNSDNGNGISGTADVMIIVGKDFAQTASTYSIGANTGANTAAKTQGSGTINQ